MKNYKNLKFESPLGKMKSDSFGSPVGVARMDVGKSYEGIGELLQKVIKNSDMESWNQIKAKIDYTFQNIDPALIFLEQETSLSLQIKKRVEKGQKLLFKPNLVNPMNIDPQTYEEGMGSFACTNWVFIAALMRWFHDKMGISYYQMMIGEAATAITATASMYSNTNENKKLITPEAVIEGKSGDFYGGWGFYFVRKYLAESLKEGETEDPLQGFEESVNGVYIPPGQVSDKLMVYDLNRIFDDPNKGRECKIPDGVNYKAITLHKVIVGGNPDNPEDINAYPGCILVNVPKFKVHAISLFTNVIKNLGIGLYPMQYASSGDYKWDYAAPHDTPIIGMKAGIPHQVWVPDMDYERILPKQDAEGNYIVKQTGGIEATMIDIIRAVINNDIFMIHVVDGIEAINIDHQGTRNGVKTREGMVFAGLDCVAIDLLCAHYMFSNVPIKEALEVKLDGGTAGGFPQKVPIPAWDGKNIITESGYDCPLSRDTCFERAENRGLGKREYYVSGYDVITESPIISLKGHLGTIKDGVFSDLITETLFYDTFKVLWDLQRTSFSYLAAVDELEGTNLKEEFLQNFDENGDGIVSYEEFGKSGAMSIYLYAGANYISLMGREKLGYLKGYYKLVASMYKNSDKKYNKGNHDVMKEFFLTSAINAAFTISQLNMQMKDFFVPSIKCGKGNWPSLQFAQFFQKNVLLYGPNFPFFISYPSLYGNALFYADLTQNGAQYAGNLRNHPDIQAVNRYIADVNNNKMKPLNFVVHVPTGFNVLAGKEIPNVEVTDDPAKIFTASFRNGAEVWP
ncbi:MAG: DUF362 domain-containing protein [Candidatus Hermodarchaeota archaeon]